MADLGTWITSKSLWAGWLHVSKFLELALDILLWGATGMYQWLFTIGLRTSGDLDVHQPLRAIRAYPAWNRATSRLVVTLLLHGREHRRTTVCTSAGAAAVAMPGFIFAGHFYATDLGLGHTITSLLDAHDLEAFNSLHLQLAIQLATQGSLSIWFLVWSSSGRAASLPLHRNRVCHGAEHLHPWIGRALR